MFWSPSLFSLLNGSRCDDQESPLSKFKSRQTMVSGKNEGTTTGWRKYIKELLRKDISVITL